MWTGSHLDTVPDGGPFDGILGSVAAIEVLRTIAENQVSLARPVEAVIFADEEGNYHHLLGSRALVEDFSWDRLENFQGRDGDLLTDALEGMGWDPLQATDTAVGGAAVDSFFELHIEQGPVLESQGFDIGIVTSIVGLGAAEVVFLGRQDHAGTTPMHQRIDPMIATGTFLSHLPDIASAVSDEAVITSGLIDVQPGGANIVPRKVTLTVDFRASQDRELELLQEHMIASAKRATSGTEVVADVRVSSMTSPVQMDVALREDLNDLAAARGYRATSIASGAGHDSQNMARLAPTAMIFVPSIGGRSHTPEELSTWDDVEKGSNLLLDAVLRRAR